MDIKEILSKCDHTILSQTATWEDVKIVLDDGIKFNVASCCIPPCFVKRAKEYVKDKVKICTVIGFPNGYSTTSVKAFEAENAIRDGADEIDMVTNINFLKNKDYIAISNEISTLRKVCKNVILKVIIETCLLTNEEKIIMSKIVTECKADYIKTSTGFSKGGATFNDVKLLKENVGEKVLVKASGGISSISDAETFISLGVSRLGTSKIVKIIKGEK
ncbi:MAG: deoxyribose-phosphate aldolase [Clostridia bacterium]|nr:deoxyribose-phosphate aldolase [Clostridia bacterium]